MKWQVIMAVLLLSGLYLYTTNNGKPSAMIQIFASVSAFYYTSAALTAFYNTNIGDIITGKLLLVRNAVSFRKVVSLKLEAGKVLKGARRS